METPVKTIAPNTLHICSAAEALALLRKHGGHGSAAFMRSLADAVLDENNHITGTVGDFNNLIDRFEALGDYFDALRVCDFALKIYPRSATLLAITLNTCARSGANGEPYLAAAESLGRENWNEPRLFKDAAEYCRTRALCCPPSRIPSTWATSATVWRSPKQRSSLKAITAIRPILKKRSRAASARSTL